LIGEEDALFRAIRVLEQASIPYMVAGSIASSYHGRPRATHDADLVIDPDPQQLARAVQGLTAQGFWVDADRAQDSLVRRLQLNAIEIATGWKIDFVFRKDRPFSREELRRRQVVRLAEYDVAMASPEDVILSRLEWARKAGGSERQVADARGVLELNPGLDRSYVDHWAAELGIADLWKELTQPPGPRRS
jgi:hypothetical protein